jgi:hypothetical protein
VQQFDRDRQTEKILGFGTICASGGQTQRRSQGFARPTCRATVRSCSSTADNGSASPPVAVMAAGVRP